MDDTTSPSRSARGATERLFLAVGLTDELRAALEAHLRGRDVPGRAVPPASWHLTLRFLGDTLPCERARVVAGIGNTALGAPFALRFGRPGAFPRPARASVLWLGVEEGEAPLRALAAAVEAATVRAGFAPEPRPFSPHLTLSRIRPPRDVRAALEGLPPFRGEMPVDEVVLFRSRLGAGGARYEALERFPLRP